MTCGACETCLGRGGFKCQHGFYRCENCRRCVGDDLDRARALISWIEGACVDELPHRDICDAVTRWKAGEAS